MPATIPVLTSQRVAAVDALRGATFVVMLFVNFLAGAQGIPYGIQHMAASVDGMSLADVVFPAFLFVVGTSIPFSLNRRLTADQRRATVGQIAVRAFGLIVIGFFMVNTEEGFNEGAMGIRIDLWALCFYSAVFLVWGTWRPAGGRLERLCRAIGIGAIVALAFAYRSGDQGDGWMAPAWWGILGCIGWAYLAASLLYLFGRGRAGVLGAAIVACVAWFAFRQANAASEVLAMHATHTSIVLCGALATLLLFDERRSGAGTRLAGCALFAALLCAVAWVLHHWYPISKISATPPWALYCSALCAALLAALYWLIEQQGHRRWTALVAPAASSPLVTYLLPIVLGAAMHYLHLQWIYPLRHGVTAILSAIVFAAATVAVVAVLNKRHFKLKL